jgi:hypothetical protein
MVDFDIEKLRELTAQDLNTRQLSALEAIRGIGRRQPGGIGTSGLTLGEMGQAEEISEAGPDLMEAGYGPQEYNPQQRYQTRFSQRSAIGDGEDPFQNLEAQTALGLASNIMPQQPTDLDMTNPAWQPTEGGGGGEGRGGDYGGPGSLGSQFTADLTPASVGFNPLSPFASSALQGGLMGGIFGGVPGALQGVGMGLQSILTSPMTMLNMLDKLAGTAYGQHQLSSTLDDLGLSTEEMDRAALGTEVLDPANLSTREKMGAEAINEYDPSERLSSRLFGGLMSALGFGDENTGLASQPMSQEDISQAMTDESLAERYSNPEFSRLQQLLGPSLTADLEAGGMDKAPGGLFSGLSSTDVRDLSSDELQDLMGRKGKSVMGPTPMTEAESLSQLMAALVDAAVGGAERQEFGGNVGTTDGFGGLGEAANLGTQAAALGYGDSWGVGASFSDPFGMSGDGNGGSSGGSTGGNMGGGSAPGGVSGDRGDRGSGMGAGMM